MDYACSYLTARLRRPQDFKYSIAAAPTAHTIVGGTTTVWNIGAPRGCRLTTFQPLRYARRVGRIYPSLCRGVWSIITRTDCFKGNAHLLSRLRKIVPRRLSEASILNRNAVEPSSPGLAASAYPGITDQIPVNRRAVAAFPRRIKNGRNRVAVGHSQNRVNPG